ncbi:MAG: S8 family serine peptidase, partial [Thermomicrobiales bacterium]|nr:S8 family serine peptidase [Thermomicrobiales bacterium]
GGLGPIRCGEHDDTLATFSNYGRKVAIAAPAVCITSLDRQGGLAIMSGTSMAAPHVAGALARYKAAAPGSSVGQARAWLRDVASLPQTSVAGFSGDRDGWAEPMLNLGS